VTLLAGCGASLPEPETALPPEHAFFEVPSPPPPARAEVVPRQPWSDAVWIDGEWTWRGARWAWKGGYWLIPPGGAIFAPSTLKRTAQGTLLLAQGAWWDASGRQIDPPPGGVVMASAREGTVVNAEGTIEKTAPNLKVRKRR
jgi:hypothetical protein